MRVNLLKFEGVSPDLAYTNGGVGFSFGDNNYSISFIKPRTKDGIVESVRVSFDDKIQMEKFMECIGKALKDDDYKRGGGIVVEFDNGETLEDLSSNLDATLESLKEKGIIKEI